MKVQLSKACEYVLNTIKENGGEAYVVGGAVRDGLLGLPCGDFDVTTSLPPNEILRVFYEKNGVKTIQTGIKHGTVTVRVFGENVEVTTYRADGEYNDNRHPQNVNFVNDLNGDLSRRDFTVNALCFDGKTLIDNFNGVEDCKNKIIRAIGCPEKRFKEDSLRILRALRFASTLGFSVESQTKAALFAQKQLILNLSAERVSKELFGILCGKNAKAVLTEYKEILAVILLELTPAFGFCQHSPFHGYDVYSHTVSVVCNTPPQGELRLAALLHDIAKPQTFTLDESGVGHFRGHAEEGAKIAQAVVKRLKLSVKQSARIVNAVAYHRYPIISGDSVEEAAVLCALNKLGVQTLTDVLALQYAESLSKTPQIQAEVSPVIIKAQLLLADILRENRPFCIKQLSVSGSDLTALGYTGREVGEVLNYLLNLVIQGKVKNDRAALLNALKG